MMTLLDYRVIQLEHGFKLILVNLSPSRLVVQFIAYKADPVLNHELKLN